MPNQRFGYFLKKSPQGDFFASMDYFRKLRIKN